MNKKNNAFNVIPGQSSNEINAHNADKSEIEWANENVRA